jgi:hypothetical protein
VPLSYSAHLHSPVVFGDLDGRFRPYDPRREYAESKTAAVLLAVEATRRWAGDGIYFEDVSEAAVRTESPACSESVSPTTPWNPGMPNCSGK